MTGSIIPPGNLNHGGLAKLIEESSELAEVIALIQLARLKIVAGKILASPENDEHWDGKGSLLGRLTEEIADVRAALTFVEYKFQLNSLAIKERIADKLRKYMEWDNG